MALREVLKIDTSTTAQVKLNDYHETEKNPGTSKETNVDKILDGTDSLLKDSDKFELFKQCVFVSNEPVKRKYVETEDSDCKKLKSEEEKKEETLIKTQSSLI